MFYFAVTKYPNQAHIVTKAVLTCSK